MASYSKRMMEEAARWIACNPQGDLALLKIPGLRKDSLDRAKQEQDVRLRRIEKALKANPHLAPIFAPQLAQAREMRAQCDQMKTSIEGTEVELEEAINSDEALDPMHLKSIHEEEEARIRLGRWHLAWGRSGHNVFDLSADFTAAMLLTDPRELDISEVRLPFPGLLMIIPEGFALGSEGHSYTKIHITEVSSGDRAVLEVANSIANVLQAVPKEEQAELMAHAQARLAAKQPSLLEARLLAPRPKSLVTAPVSPVAPGVLHIYATDGVHALSTTIDREGLSWESFETLPDHVDDATDRQVSQTIRQIVFGALAYATVVERALEPRETEPRKKHTGRVTGPKHWDVGRTIRLDPRLVYAARCGSREIALRLKHRHIVIGHYRNQAHGIRRAERKRIWITCHWKGPEEGATLVHTYRLDTDGVVGDGTSPTGVVAEATTEGSNMLIRLSPEEHR